jgi:hypothetical protein
MLAPSFADIIREATVAGRPVTGESAKETVKPSRRESRMIRLNLWSCPVLLVARHPWVQSAPGFPAPF